MEKQALALINSARAAIFSIAFLVAALCVGGWQPVRAQSGHGTSKAVTPGERNLQVQPATPAVVNNAQRVALVIGNSAYQDAPLANPVNDARAIVKALQESGFSVIVRENVDQRGMLGALREFGDRLRSGGTGLFYYAGHGMQIKGRNYLIPVGAAIAREDEVAYSAVDAQAVLDKMEAAGNVANIMILDACRNNPFSRSTRSGQTGLAQMDAPVGTLVAYATSPGAVASDGGGANGLYTQHLLTAIRQPGNKVEDVFKQVRANVRRDSQGKQVPWESTSLEGDFYFKAAPVALVLVAPTPVDSAAAREAALWDAVKGSNLPIEIRVYLNRYPTGRFVEKANARLAQLQSMPLAHTPVTASDTQGAATSDYQTEIDKRTEEILARLASSGPGPGQLVKPAKATPARPAAQSNHAGFTVGDRWRYQVVDKFKGEVVRNRVESIDQLSPDGTLILNKGQMRKDASGNLRYSKGTDRARTFSAAYINIPPVLQKGAKTDLNYEIDVQFTEGKTAIEVGKGSMTVKGQESVKTPAGDFTAWRVEMDILGWTRDTAGSYRWLFTGWYVPELRNYVAFDDESRNSNGSINRRERHELTSFSVRGAENLASR
jgi:hypothetical protein